MSTPRERSRRRILVLGAGGMLGHKLYQVLSDRFEVWATVRGVTKDYRRFGIFDEARLLAGVDALNFETIVDAARVVRPEVIVNAVGVIKQLPTAKDPIVALTINSILPHRLAQLCGEIGARLITMSTDCVFNGRKGNYTEADVSDAEDLYGRSKYLGEVSAEGCLTLRSSIIGRELDSAHSLVEWFLSNRGGKVRGFQRAIYSGLPTIVMANLIGDLITEHPQLSGLYQVSSDPINKCDLLNLIRDAYRVDIEIEPDDDLVIDRGLDSTRFREATGYVPAPWPELVREMAWDVTPYEEIRKQSLEPGA